jgi:uncharacterized protein (DUF983 family)
VAEPEGRQRCSTCSHSKPLSEFYAGVRECKACKRDRSRRHRADQARKLAAFERFIDVLVVLADKTVSAPEPRGTRPKAAA